MKSFFGKKIVFALILFVFSRALSFNHAVYSNLGTQTAIRSLLWLCQENHGLFGKTCHLAQRCREGDQRLQFQLSSSLLVNIEIGA
jgi:hypothetical protein